MSTFSVPTMTCGHCKAAIEKAVTTADPTAIIEVDLDSHTVNVDSGLDDAEVIAAMKSEGYEATLAA